MKIIAQRTICSLHRIAPRSVGFSSSRSVFSASQAEDIMTSGGQRQGCRYLHQSVNVRPMDMSNLHSWSEAAYFPDPKDLKVNNEGDLDASQFGYRVVPLSQECVYTSTMSVSSYDDYDPVEDIDEPYDNFYDEDNSLEVSRDNIDVSSSAALDTIEAHREWDKLLAEEADHPPHFECLKEDPYLEDRETYDNVWNELHTHDLEHVYLAKY